MLSLPFLLLFLTFIQPTAQVTYSCDLTAACGCSTNSASLTKIVGGEPASIDTWGWAVSISIDNEWLCGGSILSSSWILTAAHCVVDAKPRHVLVSAGTNQVFGFEQWRYASSVITHPDYDDELLENDIALIQVSPAFNMTDPGISKICLPIPTAEDYPPIGSTLVAIGWGALSENGSVSETLQQVTLQCIDYESSTCYPIVSNESMQICAGVPNGDKDTCFGDSGGALMMFAESKQWVVVGITSYGYGCANPDYSGVYTRLSYYLEWIRSMGVTDAITAAIVTTTTTISYSTMNMTTILAYNSSISTNESASCYQRVYLLFIIVPMMLFSIFIAL